jgi:hypothetical protein
VTASAIGWIWERIQRPCDHVAVVRALAGFDEAASRTVVARLLLASAEARRLLEATPHLIRVLRNQQGTRIRIEPSIRGPVLWSATITHRAATGFSDEVFVCASAVRDYDVAENRALAAGLRELRQAGRQLDVDEAETCRELAALRAAGRRAAQLGGHTRLRGVPTRWPSTRDLAKIRQGTARVAYQPALDLLERITTGPPLEEVTAFVDADNAAHHGLLRLVTTELEAAGVEVGPFRTWRGQLFSGHLRYLPPGRRGAGAPSGVILDDVAFVLPTSPLGSSVPALAQRYPRHRIVPVSRAEDVRRALQPDPLVASVR